MYLQKKFTLNTLQKLGENGMDGVVVVLGESSVWNPAKAADHCTQFILIHMQVRKYVTLTPVSYLDTFFDEV